MPALRLCEDNPGIGYASSMFNGMVSLAGPVTADTVLQAERFLNRTGNCAIYMTMLGMLTDFCS